MKSFKEIKAILDKNKTYLFSKYPLKNLAIFGSYSRNKQTIKSDLDLLVEFNEKIGIRFIDLADELEKIIGFKVDLVSRKAIKESYFKSIKPDLNYV